MRACACACTRACACECVRVRAFTLAVGLELGRGRGVFQELCTRREARRRRHSWCGSAGRGQGLGSRPAARTQAPVTEGRQAGRSQIWGRRRKGLLEASVLREGGGSYSGAEEADNEDGGGRTKRAPPPHGGAEGPGPLRVMAVTLNYTGEKGRAHLSGVEVTSGAGGRGGAHAVCPRLRKTRPRREGGESDVRWGAGSPGAAGHAAR